SIHGPYVSDHRPNTPIVLAQAAIFEAAHPSANQQPAFILQTDKTWKTRRSPNKLLGVWDSNRMGGELWNAQAELPEWNQVSCDESTWDAAVVYYPKLSLSAQQVEKNFLFDEIKPIAMEVR